MKKLLAILLCASAFAADIRVSTYTDNTPRQIERRLQSATLFFNTGTNTVPVQRIQLRSWVSKSDGEGYYSTTEWSKEQLLALPETAKDSDGKDVPNVFRLEMLKAWDACDALAKCAQVAWDNPAFVVPVVVEPKPIE